MLSNTLHVCKRCVLPESFPGIRFDSQGVCNICAETKKTGVHEGDKARYREKFAEILKEKTGKSCYDVIICFSGGKDSTFTLRVLKDNFGLNVLALTFDNGFIAEQARKNITSVVEKLGVDHLYFKPRFDMLSAIFRQCAQDEVFSKKTIERASTICTACMAIIKFSTLRLAIEKRIPLIAFGWSPGQAPITSSIMKNNPSMIKVMQDAVYEPLKKIAGDFLKPYFLEQEHFTLPDLFPYNIHPLAFLDYNEDEIYKSIALLGWEPPKDVDPNSTNCLLNTFANMIHKKHYNYNPYAFELAGLVRDGYMDRKIALERLQKEEDLTVLRMVEDRLGFRK